MRTLVTGGAGFIGLHLVRSLLEDADSGDEIHLVDHLRRHGRDLALESVLADPRVTLHEIDLVSRDAVFALPRRFDRIHHFAAIVGVEATMSRPLDVLRTNTVSAMNVFDWAAEGGLAPGGRLLFSSTSEVYSFALEYPGLLRLPTAEDAPLVVSDPTNPRSAYTASKIFGETYLLQMARAGAFDAAVVRFHNVYGPRMGKAHVIPQVIDRILAGISPLERFGAEQTRSFCHVADAVRAVRALADCDGFAGAGLVHVGDDRNETPIAALYESLLAILGRDAEFVDRAPPAGSPSRRLPSIEKLRRLTGFSPQVTLEEGLRDTVAWYLAQESTRHEGPSRLQPASGPMPRIPLCVPSLTESDARAVADCVRSGWVSAAGAAVDGVARFLEDRLGLESGTAVPMSTGTAALELALRLCNVRAGDLVLLPSLTFAGTANAVYAAGALPYFVDVERESLGLAPDAVESFLSRDCARNSGGLFHRETGRRVGAIVPVHLYGQAAPIEVLSEIAASHRLSLVEDAAEALGATSLGRPLGTFGDFGVFSFNGNKVVTGGSGGLLVAKSRELAQRAKHLATTARVGAKDDGAEWIHDEVGFNYRMTNLTASLLLSQLARLDQHLARKRTIAAVYAAAFADLPGIEVIGRRNSEESAHWLAGILVNEAFAGENRRGLARSLHERGIETRPFFAPLTVQPAFARAPRGEDPMARELWRDGLCLPTSPDLGEDELARVIDGVRAALPLLQPR